MTGNSSTFYDYEGGVRYGEGNADNDFQKDCDVPTGETSTFENAWMADGLAAWRGTITLDDVDFGGRAVGETPVSAVSGDGQYDSCYFVGSQYQYSYLSGGIWQVGKGVFTGNNYGYDQIGWFDDAITYYRTYGTVPCGYRLKQRMSISCSAEGDWQEYKQNIVGGDIFGDHITSVRHGIIDHGSEIIWR